jgi:hypothetical protein
VKTYYWEGTGFKQTWLERVALQYLWTKKPYREAQARLIDKLTEARRALFTIAILTRDSDFASSSKKIANEALRKTE